MNSIEELASPYTSLVSRAQDGIRALFFEQWPLLGRCSESFRY